MLSRRVLSLNYYSEVLMRSIGVSLWSILTVMALCPKVQATGYEGVTLAPFDRGGNQWTFSPLSFQKLSVEGALEPNEFTVEASNGPISSCLIQTPWVPVSHADGVGNLFPDFELFWAGWLSWREPIHEILTEFIVDIRNLDGAMTSQHFEIGTANMTLELIHESGTMAFYTGRLQTSVDAMLPLVMNFSVAGRTEIRMRVCDLWIDSDISIRGFVLRTTPIGA